SLRAKLNEQRFLIKYNILQSILQGNPDQAAIEKLPEMNLSGPYYGVMAIRCIGAQQLAATCKDQLLDILEHHCEKEGKAYAIDLLHEQYVIVICNANDPDADHLPS